MQILCDTHETSKHSVQKLRSYHGKEQLRKMLDDAKSRSREKGCTFQPQITSHGSAARSQTSTEGAEVHDRLYQQREEMEQRRTERAKQAAEQEKRELTFKPKLGSRRSSSAPRGGRAPSPAPGDLGFLERTMAKMEEAAQMHERLRLEKEERELQGFTGKPQVNRRRSFSAGEKNGGGPSDEGGTVYERLARPGKNGLDKKEKIRESRDAEYTFQPRINRGRSRSRSRSRTRGDGGRGELEDPVRSASAPRNRSRLFEELYEDDQIKREKIAKKQVRRRVGGEVWNRSSGCLAALASSPRREPPGYYHCRKSRRRKRSKGARSRQI